LVNATPPPHHCTCGACHLAIIPVSGRRRSTHITYNIIYELYTLHIIYIYVYYSHDMIFHYNIWRNDTRPLHVWWPPAGPTTVVIIHGEDIWSAVSFWFFGIFFSALCVSPLRRDRYTDCDGSRLLLRYKLYTRYSTHIPSIVVGPNDGLRSFICL